MAKVKFHDVSEDVRYANLLKKGKWYRVFKTNSHEIACVLAFSSGEACHFIARYSAQKEDAESYVTGMMHAIPVNAIVSRRIILQ